MEATEVRPIVRINRVSGEVTYVSIPQALEALKPHYKDEVAALKYSCSGTPAVTMSYLYHRELPE